MAEEPQEIINMDVDSNGEGEGEGEENEEFYENIEAPKFVDFTTPDHYHPDDRYWFCLRVGCDRKHEEELDPEAIYKNFVLRVMAARSPNVRFQKALNRTASSKYMKCPGSAPQKSSKSRLSRLAVISSFSGKLVDNKGNVRPLPKLTSTSTSTPKVKTKQVAAKYLTTPRNKKCLPNPNSFRSVQNPKPTSLAVPKNRTVAKALAFHSPKKGIIVKTSVELRTPLTKLCDGMKRLELTSQRKRGLAHCSKSSKDPGLGSNKSLPVKSSRKLRVTFKDQSSEKTPLQSQTRSARETKPSMKSKTKGNLTKQCHSKEIAENGSSAVKDIDSNSSEANEKHPNAKKMLGQCSSMDKKLEEFSSCSEMPPSTGTSDLMSSSAVSRELQFLPTSEQTEEEGNDVQRFQVPNRKEDDCSEGNEQENSRAVLESGRNGNDHSTQNQTSERAGHDSEVIDNDDKENASVFDENRGLNRNKSEARKKGMQEAPGNIKKAAQALEKNLKEGTTGMKFRKPKPTNPKPFRFRTDERGILKEANLEKKVHLLARKEGSVKASRFVQGNPHNKHDKNIHGNENTAEHQDKCNDEMPKNIRRDSQRTVLSDLTKRSRMDINSPGGQEASESATITSPLDSNSNPHLETSSRKMRSPLKRDLVQHQRLASSRKGVSSCLTPGQQLSVIKETSPVVSKPKRKGDRDEKNTAVTANGSATGSAPSRRRRPVTIPKEPNFHSSHRPKSCTKQIA